MANLDYFSKEDVISFTLLDAHTVDRLRREGDVKLPYKKVNIPKDERWNTKLMASKLLQGILAGDSIPDIAKSLLSVVGYNAASAVRNARTMVTGAENLGRLDSYDDLAEQGVIQKKVWIATADDRTRESHLELDGEEVDIDQPFSNGLMYPADPSGDPAEVYNCRCSMRDHIIGFRRADGSISYVGAERDTTSHEARIEEERERRGIEEGNVAEISADQFRESAEENLTKAEQKELFDELDRYIDSVSGDTDRLAELLDKMDDAKWSSDDPLYRGIGVEGYDPISGKNTYEELLESYRNGEPFTMQSLSWSASEDPAMKMAESKGSNQIIYVDTTEGTRDMVSIRGITEETEGKWYADNTQEVLATRSDMEFRPYKVEQDGNVAYVYVEEVPAGSAEATAKPTVDLIEYSRYTSDDRKEVLAMYEEQVRAYSSDERNAIRRYVGDTRSTQYEYEKINSYLRNGGRISSANESAIESIDRAIENFEVKEPFTARRGLNLDAFESILPDINPDMPVEQIREALVGAEYVDKGFMSASWNTWNGFSREAYLEIDVPQGKGYGCVVGNLPRDTKATEDEFILRRNTHAEIYDVDLDKYGRLIIHSRIVED